MEEKLAKLKEQGFTLGSAEKSESLLDKVIRESVEQQTDEKLKEEIKLIDMKGIDEKTDEKITNIIDTKISVYREDEDPEAANKKSEEA